MTGQSSENIRKFAQSGYDVKVRAGGRLKDWQFTIDIREV